MDITYGTSVIKYYDFTVINDTLKCFYLALSDTVPTVVYLALSKNEIIHVISLHVAFELALLFTYLDTFPLKFYRK